MLRTSMTVCCVGAVYGVVLAMTSTAAHGQCEVTETAEITASDGLFGDEFGRSVAISGNTMIVGAPTADAAGDAAGAAYIYMFDGVSWIEQPKLLASDPAPGDRCGSSVAVHGTVAVVGAPFVGDTSIGAVYVFRFNGSSWMQEQKLVPPVDAGGASFGSSVAVQGTAIVVGAKTANGATGAAYVFRFDSSTWADEDTLTATDAATNDRFGNDVDIDGDVILVGAHKSDDNGSNSGSFYAFRFESGPELWGDGIKITASDAAADDMFGWRVSVSGDVALVAANTQGIVLDSGAAYVFRYDGAVWNEEQKLTPPAEAADPSEFAIDVAVDGSVAVVGAFADKRLSIRTGAAYVYSFDGASWIQQASVVASNGLSDDAFGLAVELSGDVALIGALQFLSGPGTAYTYGGLTDGIPDQCQATCPWDLDGDGAIGITDFLALLGLWGTDPGGPPDFDGDQDVGITDFLALLGNWGACP